MLGASLHPFVVVVAAAFFVVGFPTWRLCGSRERGLERYKADSLTTLFKEFVR